MARKVDQRLSYCLKHQDRLTDTRCAACLKPICEECTLTTELGKFCGNECYEKRLASNERIGELKAKDGLGGTPLWKTLLSLAMWFLFLAALWFVFQNLPVAWKGAITKSFKGLWKGIKAAFGHK